MTKTNVIPTKVFALEKKNKEIKEKRKNPNIQSYLIPVVGDYW